MKQTKPRFLEYVIKSSPNGAYEIKQVFYHKQTGQKMKMNIKHKLLFCIYNVLAYFFVFFGLTFSGFIIGHLQGNQMVKILYYISAVFMAILLVLLIDAIKYMCINFEFIQDETIAKQE